MKCSICGGTMEYARGKIQSTVDNEVVGHLCGGCYHKLRSSDETQPPNQKVIKGE